MNVMMMDVPHKAQRYDTAGDWRGPSDNIVITVSRMGNWRYEMLVAIHELVECVLCLNDGVSEQEVTDFDIKFEENRESGDDSEPGDSPKAPYKRQHFIATTVERILAEALKVDWNDYETRLNAL